MKKDELCTVKKITYERSDTVEKQGNYEAICKYLEKGYIVKESRNGYWVLVRKARVVVKVENSTGIQNVNLKRDILDHYGKKKITENQVAQFAQDLEKGKLGIYCDINGSYFIKKVNKVKKSS